jgi:hypothetical protein
MNEDKKELEQQRDRAIKLTGMFETTGWKGVFWPYVLDLKDAALSQLVTETNLEKVVRHQERVKLITTIQTHLDLCLKEGRRAEQELAESQKPKSE